MNVTLSGDIGASLIPTYDGNFFFIGYRQERFVNRIFDNQKYDWKAILSLLFKKPRYFKQTFKSIDGTTINSVIILQEINPY